MAKQIICKVHDKNERIKSLGIEGEGVLPMLNIWERIYYNKEVFYTLEDNKQATVIAVLGREGNKYLTTHPDRTTVNNLDELRGCSI